jgi:hypothetical protein
LYAECHYDAAAMVATAEEMLREALLERRTA